MILCTGKYIEYTGDINMWCNLINEDQRYASTISPLDIPDNITTPTQLPSWHPIWDVYVGYKCYKKAHEVYKKLLKCKEAYSKPGGNQFPTLYDMEFYGGANRRVVIQKILELRKDYVKLKLEDYNFIQNKFG